jgi:hypothetical protein
MISLIMADKNAFSVTKNLGLGVIHGRGVQAIFYHSFVLCGSKKAAAAAVFNKNVDFLGH